MVLINEALRIDEDTGILDDYWNVWAGKYSIAGVLRREVEQRSLSANYLKEYEAVLREHVPTYAEYVRSHHPTEADLILVNSRESNVRIEDRLAKSYNRHMSRALQRLNPEKPQTVSHIVLLMDRFMLMAVPRSKLPSELCSRKNPYSR